MSEHPSRNDEARWLEGDHWWFERDRKTAWECAASREAVIEHGDTACPLCELPASMHQSEGDR